MDTIADFDSQSSQSQKSEPELNSQQDDDSSESTQNDPCEKSDPMCFEEMLIDGQIFCIIPTPFVKCDGVLVTRKAYSHLTHA